MIILKLIITVIFLTTPIASSLSSDFLGVIQYLNKYKKEIDNRDLYHSSAVFQRCSGVFGAYGKYLPSADKDMKMKFVTLSVKALETATLLLNKANINKQSENIRQVDTAVRYFVDQYYKQLEIEQLNTGSIMQGITAKEMQLCIKLIKG